MISWLGPAVLINIYSFLFDLSFLFRLRRGFSLTFLAFRFFGFLRFRRRHKVHSLVFALSILSFPYAQITNRSNVLFNMIEILANETILILSIIAKNHISVAALLN